MKALEIKAERTQGPSFHKKQFKYKGVPIRIADIEEPYLNTTLINTRCIAPNNEPFGPTKGRNQSLKSLICETVQYLEAAEANGINVIQRLCRD